MTQATPINFKDFLIKLGNGDGPPETFTKAPLAMTSRGFNQTLKTTDITVPDTTNEDLPVPEQSVGDTITREMSGKGILQSADVATWDAWFRSGVAKNVKVTVGASEVYTGPALLTAFNLSGDRTNVVTCDVTIKASGDMTLAAS